MKYFVFWVTFQTTIATWATLYFEIRVVQSLFKNSILSVSAQQMCQYII